MSFWDGVKVVGNAILESVQNQQESIMHYKELCDRYDDERLLKQYKSSTGDRKIACGMLLRERGYGKSDE